MTDKFEWLTPREHALRRPDTYAGGVNPVETEGLAFLPDESTGKLACKVENAVISPALFKIIDEPIQNAMDNRTRHGSQKYIRMTFKDTGEFSVANDGGTIPIVLWKDTGRYTPEILFSELMSGENFDDEKKRIDVGGRNGMGVKITALLSSDFVVECVNVSHDTCLFERTEDVSVSALKQRASNKDKASEQDKAAFAHAVQSRDGVSILGVDSRGRLDEKTRFLVGSVVYANVGKLRYTQRFEANLSKIHPPVITRASSKDRVSSTTVRFTVDLPRLGMSAPLAPPVMHLLRSRAYDVAACGDKLAVYLDDAPKPIGIKSVKEYIDAFGGVWIGRDFVTGGTTDAPISLEVCVSGGTGAASPIQLGFVNGIRCSQGTHMELVLGKLRDALNEAVAKHTKSKTLSKLTTAHVREHLNVVVAARIVNPSFTTQTKEKLQSKMDALPAYECCSSRLHKALEACGAVRQLATLLTDKEDRAVARALKTDKHRVSAIPKYERALKVGNKKQPCHLYITEGDSAKGLAVAGFSVIGRDYNGVFPLRGKLVNVNGMTVKKALEHKEIKHLTSILGLDPSVAYTHELAMALPYRHLVVFTDQDNDGSHIMGLLLNWLICFYPTLLAAHPTFVKRFATPIIRARIGTETRSFFTQAEYRAWAADRQPAWVKYFKGLGTSTNEDAKLYFRNLDAHMITVRFDGDRCRDHVDMWFHKQRTAERKVALSGIDHDAHVDYGGDATTMEDFCTKELVGFGAAANERSLCHVVDGLKPSQRKALYATLKRKGGEVKVAQLAAGTAELTAYHHGEQAMVQTIVHMAQPWMGANNVALLAPNGMFGSRHMPREEHSAPRYIFTEKQPIARFIFPVADDAVLDMAEDDGKQIEPKLYAPVVPMLLVNGSKGIGSGWRNECPAYAMRDLIQNTRRLVGDQHATLAPMQPTFLGFKGTVRAEGNDFVFTGTYDIDADGRHVHIRELPPRVWTGPYVEALREKLVGEDAKKYVLDIDDVSTTDDVHVILRVRAGVDLAARDLVDDLELSRKITLSDLNFWDTDDKLHTYSGPEDIMRAHAAYRREMYAKRRAHTLKTLAHEVALARSRARYVLEVNAGQIQPNRMTEGEVCDLLRTKGFYEHENFEYIRRMGVFTLTLDRAAHLEATADGLAKELEAARRTTIEDMWHADLDALAKAYDAYERDVLAKRARCDDEDAGPKKKKKKAPTK